MMHSSGFIAKKYQQGVALLTILVMVVIATVLATTMMAKQHRFVKETSMMLHQDRVYAAALAGEQMAIAVLKKDAKVNKTDSFKDIWTKPSKKISLGDSKVSYEIIDISGKYNINNLHHSGKVDKVELAFFERLLVELGLPKTLAEAVIDWQDYDTNTTGKNGAENDYYAAQKIVPANQDFYDINELKLVRGFDENAFQAIKPYITAVPRFTTMNVNSVGFPVLNALSAQVDRQAALKWVETRKERQPIEQVSQLFGMQPFTKITSKQKKEIEQLLATTSQLFVIKVTIERDNKKSYLFSHVFKHDDIVSYQRQFSNIVLMGSKTQ